MKKLPFLVGLSLTTGSTLALEVLDTRLLSVLTWYSLAFLVIAMGLFGLTAGAVRVYLRADEYTPERLAATLSRDAAWMSLAVPVSYGLLLVIPLRAEPVATTVPLFIVFAAALALPFYPAGAVTAAAITRASFPIGTLYAVDLIGAALGAPLVPLLLRALGGGTAILAIGATAALGALCFAISASDAAARRRALYALAASVALCIANGSTRHGLVPLWVKGQPEYAEAVETELWNSHSRVQVMRAGLAPAAFWGKGERCEAPLVVQRNIVIDGHAATPLYHAEHGLEELAFLDCDVTNLVHRIRPGGAAAIIGVGGSRDLQSALLAGHAPVVGIELNDRLLEILKGPLGAPTGVPSHPSVRLVHDEARSWLSRTDQRFRVIQASLIDTWAATGAGAHALGENGLYTVEAWRLFLDRLEPGGVFTVSRWSTVETARLLALAVGSLLEHGAAEPRQHIALVASGMVTTLILGKDPLTPDDLARIERAAAERGFTILELPNRPLGNEPLERLLLARDPAELDRLALHKLLDFRPPHDDKPFFFNVVRLPILWSELPPIMAGTIEGNLLATRTLGLALFASVCLVIGAIVVPLMRRARPRGRSLRQLLPGIAYFSLIGVGFMLAEIALLQRLSLVLGHPTYSLVVVLASLVAAAGLGSLVSDRLPLDRKPLCYVYPLVLATLLAALGVFWPALTGQVAAASTPARIGFAVAVTGVVGAALGVAFPCGMRLVRPLSDEETPWLWGMNGVGSVLASSAAILIALDRGLTVVMLCAAACYVALLVPIVVLVRAARS